MVMEALDIGGSRRRKRTEDGGAHLYAPPPFPPPRSATHLAQAFPSTQNFDFRPPVLPSGLPPGPVPPLASHHHSAVAIFHQDYTPPLRKKKRKYKPRERKFPIPFLSNLVRMFEDLPDFIQWRKGDIAIPDPKNLEKKLTSYFRHGNYNSFLRQLNNFGFNKVETPNETCTIYVRVQGEKVTTIEGLLALRPRERKPANHHSSEKTPDDLQPPGHCLAPPATAFSLSQTPFLRRQTQHHHQMQQQQQPPQKKKPWARRDDATNASPRGRLLLQSPLVQHKTLHHHHHHHPVARVAEERDEHLQQQQKQQKQQMLRVVHPYQVHNLREHHQNNLQQLDANEEPRPATNPRERTESGDIKLSRDRSAYPTNDDGPIHDELSASTGSSEQDVSMVAEPACPKFMGAEMSNVEALLSLSGNSNKKVVVSNDETLRATAHRDNDDDCYDATDKQHHRLPEIMPAYTRPPPKHVVVSPPRTTTGQNTPSHGSRRTLSATFPKIHANKVATTATPPLSSPSPSSRVTPTARKPSKQPFAPKTEVEKLQYEVARMEHENYTALAENMVLRATLDDLRTCVTCSDKPRVCVFADCGHFVMCVSCARGHSHTEVRCPHCRCNLVLGLDISS